MFPPSRNMLMQRNSPKGMYHCSPNYTMADITPRT